MSILVAGLRAPGRPIAVCGAGGFAREVLLLLEDCGLLQQVEALYESDDIWNARTVAGLQVRPVSHLDADACDVVLAVGEPAGRRRLRALLPAAATFRTLVHPSIRIARGTTVGAGAILCSGAVLTCDITIGRHVLVDRVATIGHDCTIGDFATLAPGVVVSGNCVIGHDAYVGAGACIRQRIDVAPHAIVGMGAVVVAGIAQACTYVGNPARLLPKG